MLEQIGGPSRYNQNAWKDVLKTVAPLRIGSGLVLLFSHAWSACLASYQFFWKEIPWDWVPVFQNAGVPVAHLTAPLIGILLFCIALAWITGFLTRLAAILMGMVCIGGLMFSSDNPSFDERCWLYLLISITLALFGSGNFSLDKLFRRPDKIRDQSRLSRL